MTRCPARESQWWKKNCCFRSVCTTLQEQGTLLKLLSLYDALDLTHNRYHEMGSNCFGESVRLLAKPCGYVGQHAIAAAATVLRRTVIIMHPSQEWRPSHVRKRLMPPPSTPGRRRAHSHTPAQRPLPNTPTMDLRPQRPSQLQSLCPWPAGLPLPYNNGANHHGHHEGMSLLLHRRPPHSWQLPSSRTSSPAPKRHPSPPRSLPPP